MNRFLKGLTAGVIIGASAGMTMSPQIDRKTRKKIIRNKRNMMHKAENIMGNVMDWM